MKNNFKEGDLVEISGHVAKIKKVENGKIIAYYWGIIQELNEEEVNPIKIRGDYDSRIKLKIPLLAPYVDIRDEAPILKFRHYLEWQDICDVIKKCKFNFVHELQHWLSENEPTSSLVYYH